MINNDYQQAVLARLQAERLYAEADRRRLIAEYRNAHPEQRFRPRLARLLRSTADRIAPAEPLRPARRFTAVSSSRPSPS